jgi:hypothetical protein
LRDKAERICAELATLYQRMDELPEQIRLHQEADSNPIRALTDPEPLDNTR